MTFPDRLRQLRQERGLSQQELGKVLGLSKANISKFETGKLQPSLQHLIALVQYFEVSAEFLLGLIEVRNLAAANEPGIAAAPAVPAPSKPPPHPKEENDPFRRQMLTVLANEYTEAEKDILSRCLNYGLKQIEVIRQERMSYSRCLRY